MFTFASMCVCVCVFVCVCMIHLTDNGNAFYIDHNSEAAAPRIKKKPEDKALHTSTSSVTGIKRKTADD